MSSRLTSLFLVYLAVLLLLTFLPLDGIDRSQPVEVRLVLFRTINFALRKGVGSGPFAVLIGNIVAFMPLGIFVPLFAGKRALVLAFLAAVALSATIELGQLAVSIMLGFAYRSADVDDVVTNVFGAMLGYSAFLIYQWLRPRPPDRNRPIRAG